MNLKMFLKSAKLNNFKNDSYCTPIISSTFTFGKRFWNQLLVPHTLILQLCTGAQCVVSKLVVWWCGWYCVISTVFQVVFFHRNEHVNCGRWAESEVVDWRCRRAPPPVASSPESWRDRCTCWPSSPSSYWPPVNQWEPAKFLSSSLGFTIGFFSMNFLNLQWSLVWHRFRLHWNRNCLELQRLHKGFCRSS